MRKLIAMLTGSLILSFTFSGFAAADPRIIGGNRVSITENQWVVYLTTARGSQFCGGTLIAPNKVLTAAHCVDGRSAGSVRVVAGREDRQSDQGVVANVSRIWTHPNYIAADQGYDVAVVTLEEQLSYQAIRFASPQDTALYTEGNNATILGWGRTSEQGQTSRYLLAATVPINSESTCSNAYLQFDKESMICAGYPAGGVDTCQGDSGGPLIVNGVLAGITSWGEGCARRDKPGVYVRVATYHSEIEGQLGSAT